MEGEGDVSGDDEGEGNIGVVVKVVREEGLAEDAVDVVEVTAHPDGEERGCDAYLVPL